MVTARRGSRSGLPLGIEAGGISLWGLGLIRGEDLVQLVATAEGADEGGVGGEERLLADEQRGGAGGAARVEVLLGRRGARGPQGRRGQDHQAIGLGVEAGRGQHAVGGQVVEEIGEGLDRVEVDRLGREDPRRLRGLRIGQGQDDGAVRALRPADEAVTRVEADLDR